MPVETTPVSDDSPGKVKDGSVKTVNTGIDNNNIKCRALERSVPLYKGQTSGDPSIWLQKFNRYAELKQWNDSVKCLSFPLFLDSDSTAGQWFQDFECENKNIKDFSVIADAFLSEFTLTKTQQLSKISQLAARKQQPNESVEDYLRDIASRCRELSRSQQQHMEYAVQGLLPNIQHDVLLKEPTTLAEVRRTALHVENLQKNAITSDATCAVVSSSTTAVNSVSDDLAAIREQLKTHAEQVTGSRADSATKTKTTSLDTQ